MLVRYKLVETSKKFYIVEEILTDDGRIKTSVVDEAHSQIEAERLLREYRSKAD